MRIKLNNHAHFGMSVENFSKNPLKEKVSNVIKEAVIIIGGRDRDEVIIGGENNVCQSFDFDSTSKPLKSLFENLSRGDRLK